MEIPGLCCEETANGAAMMEIKKPAKCGFDNAVGGDRFPNGAWAGIEQTQEIIVVQAFQFLQNPVYPYLYPLTVAARNLCGAQGKL
ncbi:hypothetical protein [Dechloromonas sp. TW-R-39-2]|uniref:hypothetical protein n=1 Tax=Dechloromonas sp. TW-R-39-2 TaxID=2654218 RepID=UPI00193DE06F|nr:hypothetical protein [Dechloromonas sp. TW-R-39-2]